MRRSVSFPRSLRTPLLAALTMALCGTHSFAEKPTARPASAASAASARPALVQKVANYYGYPALQDVKEVAWTFNVKKGKRGVARSWRWDRKNHQVSFRSGPKQPWFTYTRTASMAKQSAKAQMIDKRFINDRYWLLCPFHLMWDKGATTTVTAVPTQKVTWKSKTFAATHIIELRYPKAGGGYTPGDMYKLLISQDGAVLAWSFHRGGQTKASLRTTWEQNKRFGPLRISLMHRGVDNDFQLWFSGVSVK